jgi:gamma-tubulin complex component 3
MASFNRERVEHALNELVVRIIPEDAEDDEEVANQRFDEAFEFAIDTLSAAGDPPLAPDTDHIAGLIDSRSMPDIVYSWSP